MTSIISPVLPAVLHVVASATGLASRTLQEEAAPGAASDASIQTAIHPLLAPLEAWILANPWLSALAVAFGVIVVGEILHRLVRHSILRFLEHVARQTPQQWDQALFDARLPQRLAWGVPLLIWYTGADLIPHVPGDVLLVIKRVLLASMVLVVVRAFGALLDGVNRIYSLNPRARERPIKGFLQVAAVLAHLFGLILVVSVVMDRSPVIFLSGLGAMTAVLLLVFRDTLLSLVAGVQLTTNDLLRMGDWIEMPQFAADGDVVDIALNSVTVQNWDRTLTVIPTHKFLEHSFRNWRGMQAGGGRRIKRSFHIDQSTIRFLTEEEVERLGRWELLRDYVKGKREEIGEWNREHPGKDGTIPHHRRLTNIGTLRAYLIEFLRAHPHIHQDMTLMVRQLEPGPDGLPLEIYAFTNDTRWPQYEGIQGDVFDHVLSTIPQFGLRVFQKPTGSDLAGLAGVVPARGAADTPALPAGSGPAALPTPPEASGAGSR
jgi:miniconductance mechanosensitive channel